METSEDIMREMRTLGRLDEKSTDKIPRSLQALGLRTYADRLEAALKRKADSIHRAMVIIAGIEMENSDEPPRLWTALEDAYDALSDAMGTDGETTADVEEAKTTGRHFVVKPSNNAAKMREALRAVEDLLKALSKSHATNLPKEVESILGEMAFHVAAALSAPPRNCDRLSADKCKQIFKREMGVYLPQEATDNDREIAQRTAYGVIDALFAPYTEQKGEGDGRK